MKAMVFDRHGPPDVLEYKDVPMPTIGPTEVLFKVLAAGFNYNDVWARQGANVEYPLPHIGGSDAAGLVVAVGEAVTTVKVGDEVLAHCGISCRVCDACTRGEEYFCRRFRLWGFQTGPLDGGQAEYAKLPEVNIVPKPKNLTWEEAASLPLVLVSAWRQMVTRGGVRPGDFVLIWGAAGGMGSMAVQITRLFNAHPIAVAASDDKLEFCAKIGAEHLINRKSQNVLDEVRRITSRRGADVVFEHPGAPTWPTSIQAVKWGGTITTTGATGGNIAETDLRHVYFRQLTIRGSLLGSKAELLEALKHVDSGQLKPTISQVLPLKELARGHEIMEQDEIIGKMVFVPEHATA